MRIRSLIIAGCFLMLSSTAKTQDLHFSLFDFAPAYLNPALTGAFSGTYRVGGIARQQWSQIANQTPYQTASLYVDSPIIRGIRKQDWIGVGIGFDYDRVGENLLKTSFGRLGASYHLALDKRQKNIFTIGVQMESTSRTLDLSEAVSGAAFRNGGIGATIMDDPSLSTLIMSAGSSENPGEISSSYRDVVFGLGYRSKIGKTNSLSLGLALSNLFDPNQRLSQGIDELPVKIVAHGQLRMLMSKRMSITPAFILQKQNNTWDRGISGTVGYLVKPEKGIVINGGLGLRVVNATAIEFLLGAEYKDIRMGLSYDMQVVGDIRTASNTVGGFEIAVGYIGKIYKKPNVKPLIICPRL